MLEFDPNALAFTTATLEQSCRQLKTDNPASRKFIANKLTECANAGKRSLPALIEAGQAAIDELNADTHTATLSSGAVLWLK